MQTSAIFLRKRRGSDWAVENEWFLPKNYILDNEDGAGEEGAVVAAGRKRIDRINVGILRSKLFRK